MAADNKLLGQFDLVGIRSAPRGQPQIEVSFDIDADGLVNVTAKDKETEQEQKIEIRSSGGLEQSEIDKMVREAEEHKEADAKRKQVIEAKNAADGLIQQVSKAMDNAEDPSSIKDDIDQRIQDLRKAMDDDNLEDMAKHSSELYKHLSTLDGMKKKEADSSSSAGEKIVEGESDDTASTDSSEPKA
jgi:molecular chaperone DnaK